MKSMIAALIAVILLGGVVFFLNNYNQNKIQPANLSPTPEVTNSPTAGEDNAAQAIQNILAKKYNKSPDEVKVTISKITGDFAAGTVLFGQGGPGESGAFLTKKTGNDWEVVFDGNGNVDCNKMRTDYGFPDSILKPNFCD